MADGLRCHGGSGSRIGHLRAGATTPLPGSQRLHGFRSLVILSGQVATSLIGYDAFQECDMVGISRRVVKHSFLVNNGTYPAGAEKSLLAGSKRSSGASGGGFAEGILNPAKKLPHIWPDSVGMRSYNPTEDGHKGQIKRALQTLVAAKKRVVSGGWRGNARLP
ncbi:hypothetical protein ACNKHK_00490 [Shigella flexneri]